MAEPRHGFDLLDSRTGRWVAYWGKWADGFATPEEAEEEARETLAFCGRQPLLAHLTASRVVPIHAPPPSGSVSPVGPLVGALSESTTAGPGALSVALSEAHARRIRSERRVFWQAFALALVVIGAFFAWVAL